MARTRRAPEPSPAPANPVRPKLRRGPGNRASMKPADTAAEIARKERRTRAVELKVRGMTDRAIAELLKVDESTVRADIARHLDDLPVANIERLRKISEQRLEVQHERLDTMEQLLRRQLVDEDGSPKKLPVEVLADVTKTLSRVASVVERINYSHRRLYGADAPEKHEHSGQGGAPIPVAVATTSLAELQRLAAENEEPPE